MSAYSASRWIAVFVLILISFSALGTTEPPVEEFHYRWRLTNFLGRIAGLFLPSRGDGVLTHRTNAEGNLVSQLEITSEKSEKGEFWLYGAEIDLEHQRTIRAWSAYRYRDKDKSKKAEVDERGVLDIASGILQIRKAPPKVPTDLRIWSDGKIYPVVVVPKGKESLRLGKQVLPTRRFLVKGAGNTSGPVWKGKIELWLQEDEVSTPAAILIYRNGIGVLLELNLQQEGAA